jgi:hypothetical protein
MRYKKCDTASQSTTHLAYSRFSVASKGQSTMRPQLLTSVVAALLVVVLQTAHAQQSPKRLGNGQDALRGSVQEKAGVPAKEASKDTIPLPTPRPPEADAEGAPAGPEASTAKAPEPSECRKALTEAIAIAPSIPDLSEGACGGTDLVRLEAIVLPNATRVSLKPAATLRCAMAAQLADWVRSDVAPLAESLGSTVSELDNFDSYSCRGRNRVAGAKMSEHGRANALDIRGFRLQDGRMINLTDRAAPREVRETVLAQVCARFATVLGPTSDWYHEDHIHLDLAPRRSNYRICQWAVLDPLPKIAPLLPAARPEDAPAREGAEVQGTGDKASEQKK